MKFATDIPFRSAVLLAPSGQPVCSGHGTHLPFRSLRPYWGHLLRQCSYHILPAQTSYQHGVANMLVRRMYAQRGYAIELSCPRQDDPNRTTLAVWQYEEAIATITLRRDSPAGLLADALYGSELASLRYAKRIICEVTRLAVDPDFSSRGLLSAIFQATYRYAKNVFSANDVVIEVNPRHAKYYQLRLGFQQIGTQRRCPRVDAPAVLLHLALDDIDMAGFFPRGKTGT